MAAEILDLIRKGGYIGGTILELMADNVPEEVQAFNDLSPQAKRHSASKVGEIVGFSWLESSSIAGNDSLVRTADIQYSLNDDCL